MEGCEQDEVEVSGKVEDQLSFSILDELPRSISWMPEIQPEESSNSPSETVPLLGPRAGSSRCW